jgi:two-component system CheB/CheR fusion protein
MKLDAQTLYVVLISAYLMLGIAMLYTFRRPFEDGEEVWTASLFVGVAALVLLVTRNILPDWLSIAVANVLVSVQYSLQYLALCRVFKHRASSAVLYAPTFVALVAFSSMHPSEEARHIVASGLIVGIQHLPMLALLWGRREEPVRGPRQLLLVAVALNAGRFLFRAQAALISPESTPSIFGPIHAGTLLIGIAYIILATFAMVILYRDRIVGRLRAGRQLFRSVIEGTSDGIFTRDREGRFQLINDAASRFLGKPQDEIVGRPNSDFFLPEAAERVMEADQAIMATRSVITSVELMAPLHGEERMVQVVKGPVLDENGAVAGVFGIARDITEPKRIEAELTAAKQAAESASIAKTRFLAAAGHDLRQPVQAINLFNDALGRTALDEDQKRIHHYLSLSIQSLGDLLNALLDISKLDAGLVKPQYQEIRSEDLFSKIDAQFATLGAEKGLRIMFFYPERGLTLVSDPKLLVGLLGNLIGNAIKYTERGGILVGIRRRGDQAAVQVWDTGIGIEPKHMNNIFEEYFQIGNPERDRNKGLGLGLAIARRLAKLMDIDIVCRSRPGKGSVFEFRLPLATEPRHGMPRARERVRHPAGPAGSRAGRRVVVVEDDAMVVRAIKLSLESLGMSVAAYNDAEEALADSAVAEADFHISDFRLPGLNGIQFLDALQRRSPKPLNAVVLTGDTSPDWIELTQSSRWTVMFKPIELPRLLAAIDASLATD